MFIRILFAREVECWGMELGQCLVVTNVSPHLDLP